MLEISIKNLERIKLFLFEMEMKKDLTLLEAHLRRNFLIKKGFWCLYIRLINLIIIIRIKSANFELLPEIQMGRLYI